MHKHIIENASREQLADFLEDQLDRLKRVDNDLYREMEDDLYVSINGPHFNEWSYERAVDGMTNADGTTGAHWSKSDIVKYARQKGMDFRSECEEYDFAYAMNMTYSDYYGSVPDSVETYFRIAKAFIDDADAPEGKAYVY